MVTVKRNISRLAVGAAVIVGAGLMPPSSVSAVGVYSPDRHSYGQYPYFSKIYVKRVVADGVCRHTSSYVVYAGQRLETAQNVCPASASAGRSGSTNWKVCTNKKATDSCSSTIIS